MFNFIAILRSLPRLLPFAVLLLASSIFPAIASAQPSPSVAPAVSATNSPFDELNARLGDAADQLVSHSRSEPRTQEPEAKPIPAQIAQTRKEAARDSERRTFSQARVQQLRPVVDPILRGEGIPAEFVAVALVESGGQPAALSPKGARGVWQLMPETARRYGLVVSGDRDDRLDLVGATRAAARYLRDLYAQFGDWELALAAYNAGERTVQSAIQRARSNSFAVLNQLRLLPPETRSYVPAVMNARNLFRQTTSLAEESASGSTMPNPGRSRVQSQNFKAGKVFYAMNTADTQVATGGSEVQGPAQESASSITE